MEPTDIKTSITNSLSYIRKIIYSDEKSDPNNISANEIIILLKWISTISEGNKLYVKSLEITANSVFTQLYRTFIKTESREDTLQFLYFIENKSLEILDKYVNDHKKGDLLKKNLVNQQANNLVNAIILSIDGIVALKKTYIEDKMFCCFIDNLIENTIVSKFSELKCINSFSFSELIDINNILEKIKCGKVENVVKEKSEENKSEEVVKEIVVKEETKNDLKEEIKSVNIINENYCNSKVIENPIKNKEFQISTELKDLKISTKKSDKRDELQDNDYDNDCFDEKELEEDEIDEL